MRGLDAAHAADARTDVRLEIHERPPPFPEQIVYEWGGRYALRLGRIGQDWSFGSRFDGTILVAPDGRSISLVSATNPLGPGMADIVSRRVLPRVATLFGGTALHGASLSKGDAGLLLLGSSGAGKSTTTAALAAAGWHILSDDISIVRNDGAPQLEPCTTGVCVWPDSLAALGLDLWACTSMAGYDGKMRYDPELAHRISPARFSACILLQRSPNATAIRVERLSQAEALISAIRQLVVFNPAGPHEDRALQVSRLNAIMSKTPAFRLVYPAGYAVLPAIADQLSEVLHQG
ncbi:MAG: hypothetical protein V4564_06275 [Pseudomonadota bacterium]|uniref:hypothetical protein n=1 Tax=Sphingomonas sp. ERG5 TaxID=1381597 RepID=UPI00054B26FD|nr:hypothetical protein [Sphingomonas sp. ERG5]